MLLIKAYDCYIKKKRFDYNKKKKFPVVHNIIQFLELSYWNSMLYEFLYESFYLIICYCLCL